MKRVFFRVLLVVGGILTLPVITAPAHEVPGTHTQSKYEDDPRLPLLRKYFIMRQSPIVHLAEDFLRAADSHGLDWRLLPGISVIESGGGKAYKNNNIFGWNSCETAFRSVREGIHMVASYLAQSKHYRDKNTLDKLRTYNPNPDYPNRVHSVMRRIGPPQFSGN